MKHYLVFFCILFCGFAYTQDNNQPLGKFLGAKLIDEKPSWFKSSFLEFAEDIDETSADNKHFILYIHQDGCPYCAKLIEDNFTNPSLQQKIRAHFEIVEINMWGDREIIDVNGNTTTEKEFAKQMKVQFTPTLLFFDDNANIIMRLNGYQSTERMSKIFDYVKDKHYKNKSFVEFISPNASGSLNNQQFISPQPYILSRNKTYPAKQYLAVLFETPQCPECDDFHNIILKKDNITSLLNQMEVVQLNIITDKLITPDGKKMTAKDWYGELDLSYTPALIIFDKEGREIIRKDAFFKEFHFESMLLYALEESYKTQPSFQRYLEGRADKIRENGKDVNLWK